MARVLSGIQPSGNLHLGNYFGMMSRMIQYQEKNELFAFIANYHALTSIQNREKVVAGTLEAAADFLALGLDPEKSTFWIQSDLPQVTELTWILSNVVGVGMLERATSFKDKVARGITPNVGLFSYPVLMACDILLFGSNIVPVGKDQKQHLEMTRDFAIKFNQTYGEVFVVPKPDIEKINQLVPGIDGQKMSKSYGNTIPIFGEEKILKKQIMSIVTDSKGIDEPKDTDTPLFQLFTLFLGKEEIKELKDRFTSPGLRYGDVKKELFETVISYFKPYREKREHLLNHKDHLAEILKRGAEKAALVAEGFLSKAREATGLNYLS